MQSNRLHSLRINKQEKSIKMALKYHSKVIVISEKITIFV